MLVETQPDERLRFQQRQRIGAAQRGPVTLAEMGLIDGNGLALVVATFEVAGEAGQEERLPAKVAAVGEKHFQRSGMKNRDLGRAVVRDAQELVGDGRVLEPP